MERKELKERLEIEAYHAWLRQQPCALCGHSPRRRAFQTLTPEGYVNKIAKNVVHHVGDGKSSKRKRDDLVVPLCDTYSYPRAYGCHLNRAHKYPKKYREYLRKKALEYKLLYEAYKKRQGRHDHERHPED